MHLWIGAVAGAWVEASRSSGGQGLANVVSPTAAGPDRRLPRLTAPASRRSKADATSGSRSVRGKTSVVRRGMAYLGGKRLQEWSGGRGRQKAALTIDHVARHHPRSIGACIGVLVRFQYATREIDSSEQS